MTKLCPMCNLKLKFITHLISFKTDLYSCPTKSTDSNSHFYWESNGEVQYRIFPFVVNINSTPPKTEIFINLNNSLEYKEMVVLDDAIDLPNSEKEILNYLNKMAIFI